MIKAEIERHRGEFKTNPTPGELLAEAWEFYVESKTAEGLPAGDKIKPVEKRRQLPKMGLSPTLADRIGPINPLELRCSHLLSAIFHGQNQQAIAAIASNLEAFATLTTLTSRESRLEKDHAIIDAAAIAAAEHTEIADSPEKSGVAEAATGSENRRGAPGQHARGGRRPRKTGS